MAYFIYKSLSLKDKAKKYSIDDIKKWYGSNKKQETKKEIKKTYDNNA